MDLFSLVAKLTLDTKEYEKELNAAKSSSKIDLEDPSLGLNTDAFDTAVEEVEGTEIDDPKDPDLGLDHTDFDRGIEDVQEKSGTFSETISSTFSELKGALAAAGVTTAIAGVVTFLKQGINLARDHGDAIDKQSQKLKLSTAAYQELDYALTLSGSSITDLTRSMKMFNEAAAGDVTEDQAAAFEKLGIKMKDASGNIKSGQQLMEESLYALADYKGSDAGLLQEALFGRNAAGLNALLANGSEGIKAMRQEANDLGLVMTDEEVKNAAAYMDATTRLEKSVNALKENIAGELLPGLTEVTNTIATIVSFFNGRTGENSLADEFKESDKELAKNLATIEGTSSAAGDLIDKLMSMGSAEKLTAEQQEEWKKTAEWLKENIPGLSKVIDEDTLSITANKEEITKIIDEWKRLSVERALATAKDAKYQAMMEKNAEAIDAQGTARAKENEALEKYYERIAVANQLLQDNEKLQGKFAAKFGTTEVTADAENLEEMLQYLTLMNGFQLGGTNFDNSALREANAEYAKLTQEAENAQKEADKYKEQLEKGQEEYERWVEAINEIYGINTTDAEEATEKAKALDEAVRNIPSEKRISLLADLYGIDAMPQAKGNDYVPYDNYPSLLHRGEMVLTASEANKYRNGNNSGADLSGMKTEIVSAIKEGMNNATVRSYLNGKEITAEVNRNTINDVKNRRFAT